ncbi:Rsp5p-dependent ubiquitination, sorting of cargo proteins at the multivesicular body [Phlyctochytrium bullatum]|nr:Rsp5p-dependent ubiquitination, sorting of cargo proteins at the multivesicular body [Phlyctochytrium bullatum]
MNRIASVWPFKKKQREEEDPVPPYTPPYDPTMEPFIQGISSATQETRMEIYRQLLQAGYSHAAAVAFLSSSTATSSEYSYQHLSSSTSANNPFYPNPHSYNRTPAWMERDQAGLTSDHNESRFTAYPEVAGISRLSAYMPAASSAEMDAAAAAARSFQQHQFRRQHQELLAPVDEGAAWGPSAAQINPALPPQQQQYEMAMGVEEYEEAMLELALKRSAEEAQARAALEADDEAAVAALLASTALDAHKSGEGPSAGSSSGSKPKKSALSPTGETVPTDIKNRFRPPTFMIPPDHGEGPSLRQFQPGHSSRLDEKRRESNTPVVGTISLVHRGGPTGGPPPPLSVPPTDLVLPGGPHGGDAGPSSPDASLSPVAGDEEAVTRQKSLKLASIIASVLGGAGAPAMPGADGATGVPPENAEAYESALKMAMDLVRPGAVEAANAAAEKAQAMWRAGLAEQGSTAGGVPELVLNDGRSDAQPPSEASGTASASDRQTVTPSPVPPPTPVPALTPKSDVAFLLAREPAVPPRASSAASMRPADNDASLDGSSASSVRSRGSPRPMPGTLPTGSPLAAASTQTASASPVVPPATVAAGGAAAGSSTSVDRQWDLDKQEEREWAETMRQQMRDAMGKEMRAEALRVLERHRAAGGDATASAAAKAAVAAALASLSFAPVGPPPFPPPSRPIPPVPAGAGDGGGALPPVTRTGSSGWVGEGADGPPSPLILVRQKELMELLEREREKLRQQIKEEVQREVEMELEKEREKARKEYMEMLEKERQVSTGAAESVTAGPSSSAAPGGQLQPPPPSSEPRFKTAEEILKAHETGIKLTEEEASLLITLLYPSVGQESPVASSADPGDASSSSSPAESRQPEASSSSAVRQQETAPSQPLARGPTLYKPSEYSLRANSRKVPNYLRLPSPTIVEFTPRKMAELPSLEGFLYRYPGAPPSASRVLMPGFSVLSNLPLTKSSVSASFCAYFEVTLLSADPDAVISVGLVTPGYPASRAPGWHPTSVSYLSTAERMHCVADWGGGDGSNAANPPTLQPQSVHQVRSPFGMTYAAGDTVGCGFIPAVGGVFFTLNGEFLGEAFSLLGAPPSAAFVGSDGNLNADADVAQEPVIPFHAAVGCVAPLVKTTVVVPGPGGSPPVQQTRMLPGGHGCALQVNFGLVPGADPSQDFKYVAARTAVTAAAVESPRAAAADAAPRATAGAVAASAAAVGAGDQQPAWDSDARGSSIFLGAGPASGPSRVANGDAEELPPPPPPKISSSDSTAPPSLPAATPTSPTSGDYVWRVREQLYEASHAATLKGINGASGVMRAETAEEAVRPPKQLPTPPTTAPTPSTFISTSPPQSRLGAPLIGVRSNSLTANSFPQQSWPKDRVTQASESSSTKSWLKNFNKYQQTSTAPTAPNPTSPTSTGPSSSLQAFWQGSPPSLRQAGIPGGLNVAGGTLGRGLNSTLTRSRSTGGASGPRLTTSPPNGSSNTLAPPQLPPLNVSGFFMQDFTDSSAPGGAEVETANPPVNAGVGHPRITAQNTRVGGPRGSSKFNPLTAGTSPTGSPVSPTSSGSRGGSKAPTLGMFDGRGLH